MLKVKVTTKRRALYLLIGAALAALGLLAGCHRQAATFPVTKQVVVLGFDGVDPNLAARWMAEGRLPNLARLQREGAFRPLGTTNPPESPVAWASFATGLNPGGTGIYDFLSAIRKLICRSWRWFSGRNPGFCGERSPSRRPR